jgi:hypothetical protein
MNFRRLIQGRLIVDKRQEKGLGLALEVLESLQDRTFKIKGRGIRGKVASSSEVIRFLQEELPEYYQYQTSIVAYVTRKNMCHVRIDVEGWLGIRCDLRRQSPLDMRLLIKTA